MRLPSSYQQPIRVGFIRANDVDIVISGIDKKRGNMACLFNWLYRIIASCAYFTDGLNFYKFIYICVCVLIDINLHKALLYLLVKK